MSLTDAPPNTSSSGAPTSSWSEPNARIAALLKRSVARSLEILRMTAVHPVIMTAVQAVMILESRHPLARVPLCPLADSG